MASFGNVTSHLVGRELSIASSFVKQYYTLLNKAPHLIHNFYSLNSTFIHGSVEMVSNVQYTEPMVGREKIKKKMEDLKLNDCRAKIKQIDCLETLAGGLVIQVIGELSNNGKPMRRFLQTFVLAPRADDSVTGDSQRPHKGQVSSDAYSTSSSTSTQKFFVLNSIFRYQDDALDSESEEDAIMISNASSFINSETYNSAAPNSLNNKQINYAQGLNQLPEHHQTPASNNTSNHNMPPHPHHHHHHGVQSNGSNLMDAASQTNQVRKRPSTTEVPPSHSRRMPAVVDRLAQDLEEVVKLRDSSPGRNLASEKLANIANDCKQEPSVVVPKVVSSNQTASIQQDNKSESYQKSLTENGKINSEHAPTMVASTSSAAVATITTTTTDQSSISKSANQTTSSSSMATSKPQPSNEPKTWANMVRNAQLTHTISSAQPSISVTSASTTPSNAAKTISTELQQPNQNSNQSQSSQVHSQTHQQSLKQPQPLQLQLSSPSQQSQPYLQQPQLQVQGQQQPHQQQQQHQTSQMNNNPNRRRHVQRKPSSKPNGRPMKPRSRTSLAAGPQTTVSPTTTSITSTTITATSSSSPGKPIV